MNLSEIWGESSFKSFGVSVIESDIPMLKRNYPKIALHLHLLKPSIFNRNAVVNNYLHRIS